MFTRFPGRCLRGPGPMVACCLYLLGAVTGPVAHAFAEDPGGTATIEASHSQQCDRLHSDSGCPAVGTLGTVPGDGLVVSPPPHHPRAVAPSTSADLPGLLEALSTRFVRGPPTT